jgi:hypothetical protein
MIILKWILNKIVFINFILYYNTGQSSIFGRVKKTILHKPINIFKAFAIKFF